jgi:hypothetical protein
MLVYDINYNIKDNVKLSLCLTNYAPRHEGVRGNGYIDPYFLHLCTSWG